VVVVVALDVAVVVAGAGTGVVDGVTGRPPRCGGEVGVVLSTVAVGVGGASAVVFGGALTATEVVVGAGVPLVVWVT